MPNHPHRRKLGRKFPHRWSMLRTLVSQLIEHERIETTLPKAKELRRLADKMVTLGKKGTLQHTRMAAAVVRGDEALFKLTHHFALRYKDRHGGYTRIVPTRIRKCDAALMAYIEFIDRPNELRTPKPPSPPPPPSNPLPPWLKSKFCRVLLPPLAAAAATPPPPPPSDV